MGDRNTLLICSIVIVTLHIVLLKGSFANLDKTPQSKAASVHTDGEHDSNIVPPNHVEAGEQIGLDEMISNKGHEKVKGSSTTPNKTDVDDYILCPDEISWCEIGQTCCPDADDDDIMECCKIDPVDFPDVCSYNINLLLF